MSRLAVTLLVATSCLLAVACDRPPPTPVNTSASASASQSSSPTTTPTPSPTTSSSAAYCPGLHPGHALLIESLGYQFQSVVIRDVQDPNHGVTLCQLPGPARFVSGTEVAILEPGVFTLFDLITGAQTNLLLYSHNDGPVLTEDWSSDGQVFAYGRLTPGSGAIAFHVVVAGADRVLATVTAPNLGIGTARVEFSPDDQYVALGTPASASNGDGAAVQVRRLDGSLVFSSGGNGQLTWAGESPRLYFQGPSSVEMWDALNGASLLPIAQWTSPIHAAGGRWLAYLVPGGYPDRLRLIDTRTGVDRLLGLAEEPAWVTPTLMRFTQFLSCAPSTGAEGPPLCVTRPVVYDTSDGSTTVTVPAYVFDTWPKSTPPWS
jgi:hypothetical protein